MRLFSLDLGFQTKHVTRTPAFNVNKSLFAKCADNTQDYCLRNKMTVTKGESFFHF